MATAIAAAMKRKGNMLTEAAAAGRGCAGDGVGIAENGAVTVGMGVGGGVVCTGEGTCIEGGTDGPPGEGDCPKLVGA